MSARLITLMPVAAVLLGAAALGWPAPFAAARGAIVPLLGLVMFGMGITLQAADFARVLRRPAVVFAGLALQFLLMPLLAWVIGLALALPLPLAVGLVLVGSCPGGTASNVICYLARGDVALSVSLTTLSTLAAVLATPVLTWLYVGHRVPVPVLDMLASVVQIVVAPVAVGVAVNHLAGRRLARARRVFPVLSVIAIVVIVALIVALNAPALRTLALPVALAVVLHNLLGLAGGYGAARALGMDAATRRTLAIEVGMQNSGLGVALAVAYFSPAAALPGAVFSVWHNLSGAGLAAWWNRRPR